MKGNWSTIWLPFLWNKNHKIILWSILCLSVSGHNSATKTALKLRFWEIKIPAMPIIFQSISRYTKVAVWQRPQMPANQHKFLKYLK